jgi:hypothetical protein
MQVWNSLSLVEQNDRIIKMYNTLVKAGLCSNKGRKPISDIQMVLEENYGMTLNTTQFTDRVKALLNKGDSRVAVKNDRRTNLLALLNGLDKK